MKFTVISMSQGGLKPVGEAIAEYEKRIKLYAKIECINIIPKKAKNIPVDVLRESDQALILKHIPKQSLVFLCDENGPTYTSKAFAAHMEKSFLQTSHVTLVLGPAYGLSRALLKNHQTISLSSMTLQHEIAHLVLIEQLYRALTILHNHPYHI